MCRDIVHSKSELHKIEPTKDRTRRRLTVAECIPGCGECHERVPLLQSAYRDARSVPTRLRVTRAKTVATTTARHVQVGSQYVQLLSTG